MTIQRIGQVHRVTGETNVQVQLNLDGTGQCEVDSGVAFLDHMLHQLASHGLLDLKIKASGDTHIDDHHSNEDVGIAVGQALAKALGDRRGIQRDRCSEQARRDQGRRARIQCRREQSHVQLDAGLVPAAFDTVSP